MSEYSVTDLGAVTAYAQAVENGYTGTLEQWALLQINAANNYSELFSEIYSKNSSAALWEQGGLSASTGNTSTSTVRVRTTDYLPESIAKIVMNTGYYVMIYAYDSEGVFQGVLKNNYDIEGDVKTVEFLTDLNYIQSCLTGTVNLRGIVNCLKELPEEDYVPMKFKVVGAYGAQGTTAISPDSGDVNPGGNIFFYENNVGYAVDNDIIAVGSSEPDSERAVMWINNSNQTTAQIPEIDDENVSDVDTWSSEKISEEFRILSDDIEDVSDAVNDIKTDLGGSYSTVSDYTFTDGTRYLLEAARVGAVVSTSTSRNYYKCTIYSATAGDAFMVSIITNSNDVGHVGFLDSDRKLLSYLLVGSGGATRLDDYAFVCPANTAYVVFNDTSNGYFVLKKYVTNAAASENYVDNAINDKFDITSTSRSYNDDGIPSCSGYLPDAVRVVANSLTLDNSVLKYYTRIYDHRGHDSTMVIVDGVAYTAYLGNDTDTGDSPSSNNAFVNLGITNITNLNTSTSSTNVSIAKYGDTVGELTITSGAGVPNIVNVDGVLHIIFSCKLSDNNWYVLKRTYTISSSALSSVEKCSLSVDGATYDMTSANFNTHVTSCRPSTFLSCNAQIAYDGTGYYMGVCENELINVPPIMYSTDLTTWELFTIPNITAQANFECACYYYGGYLYLAVRQKNALAKMILAKINTSTKAVLDTTAIDDCGARACFFEWDSGLYLAKSGKSRYRSEILRIETSALAKSTVAYQSIVQMLYPSVAIYNDTAYLSATGNHSMFVYLRKMAFGSYTTDDAYDMLAKMVSNYLA